MALVGILVISEVAAIVVMVAIDSAADEVVEDGAMLLPGDEIHPDIITAVTIRKKRNEHLLGIITPISYQTIYFSVCLVVPVV